MSRPGISGSIDVPVTCATNMPGFTATPGTSVQPISSGLALRAPEAGRGGEVVDRDVGGVAGARGRGGEEWARKMVPRKMVPATIFVTSISLVVPSVKMVAGTFFLP